MLRVLYVGVFGNWTDPKFEKPWCILSLFGSNWLLESSDVKPYLLKCMDSQQARFRDQRSNGPPMHDISSTVLNVPRQFAGVGCTSNTALIKNSTDEQNRSQAERMGHKRSIYGVIKCLRVAWFSDRLTRADINNGDKLSQKMKSFSSNLQTRGTVLSFQ